MRCSRTNNHTTREAACTCIAELASKIDAEAVRPHAPVMLRTLITCLRDDSWPVSHPTPKDQQFQVTNPCGSGLHLASHLSWRPATGSQKAHKCRLRDSCCMQVRDAALLATGKCAASFPEECRASLLELYKLWTGHLDDNIPSVRADAAAALGDALQAYKQELLEQLLPLIRQELPCVIHAASAQSLCYQAISHPSQNSPHDGASDHASAALKLSGGTKMSLGMPRNVLIGAQDHAAKGTRTAYQQREQQIRRGGAAAHCNAWLAAWDACGVS